MMRLLALVLWVLASTGLTSAVHGEQIASYQGLTASVSDGTTCGPSARVTINAPDASAYSGDRVPLQNLIGGIRANFADCPKLQSIDLNGVAKGKTAFRGTISAANGWQLPAAGQETTARPSPSAGSSSALFECEFDPNDPLVGCWASVAPRKLQGFISIIHRDHSWFTGRSEQLAAGRSELSGREIQRTYAYGIGAGADVIEWGGAYRRIPAAAPVLKLIAGNGFSMWTGPYFSEGCSVLTLMPYAPFGIGGFGGSEQEIFYRLRPRVITAEMFRHGRTSIRDLAAPAGNLRLPYCNNAGQAGINQFVSSGIVFAIPLFAELSTVEASELFPSALVKRGAAGEAVAGRGAVAGEAAITGEARAGGAAAENNATRSVRDIVMPNGSPVGKVFGGATPNITTVGTEEFSQIENDLMKLKPASGSQYANGTGRWYDLPDGTRFGIRQNSSSGSTIDFDNPSLPRGFKIHQK